MTEEISQERLIFYNPWWTKREVPLVLVPEFRRAIFIKLWAYLDLDRILVLKGPRRTGKSTLLYQLMAELLHQGVQPERIWYLNFEDVNLRSDLHALLQLCARLNLVAIDSGPMIYAFLDEVQLLSGWAEVVKAISDKKYPIRFVCSGSAASLLAKGSESLAGRTVEELILPWSFREWSLYHEPELQQFTSPEQTALWTGKLQLAWQKYLHHGGFAHLLEVDDLTLLRKLLFEDIVEKVIYRDLVDLYGIREPQILEKIFYYLISISSGILNISHLASLLGVSRETVRLYLSYLRSAYLYFGLPKYSRSVKQTLASAEKIHPIDPAFCLLTSQSNEAALWESAVAAQLWQNQMRNIYYWRDRLEVDLVIEQDEQLLPIEVKSGSQVSVVNLKGLRLFMKQYHVPTGVVIYGGPAKELPVEEGIIRCLPVVQALWFGVS